MPINPKYLAKFYTGNYYHIYNRSHSQRKMFLTDENYFFFLRLLKKYLSHHLDFFAYCLLPNHFHLFVKVRDKEGLTTFEKLSTLEMQQTDKNINDLVSNQFKKMFIAYSNAFNKKHNMHGGIFETPFKRVIIDDDNYFSDIIYYIHCNPLHHNMPVTITDYPYSSYKSFLSDKPTLLQRDKMFEWFGGRDAFIKQHEIQKTNYLPDDFIIE
jgi:REP element-mobilizing transposase RayT